MTKRDEFSDLQNQMRKLQKDRHKSSTADDHEKREKSGNKRIMSMITPIITTFVEADQFLEMQSGDQSVYLTYAHAKVCRISVTESGSDHVHVELHANHITTSIYSGGIYEKAIRNAVKDALLNWYRSVL